MYKRQLGGGVIWGVFVVLRVMRYQVVECERAAVRVQYATTVKSLGLGAYCAVNVEHRLLKDTIMYGRVYSEWRSSLSTNVQP